MKRTRIAIPMVALALAAFTALVGVSAARTASFFLLHPNTASPGERVTARTPGTPVGFHSGGEARGAGRVRTQLYLVENPIAERIASPRDPRLNPIGVIEIDRNSHGSLTFVVPEIDGGTYTVAHLRLYPCDFRPPGWPTRAGGTICGPAFLSLSVDDQVVSRYRPLMTLRVRGDESVWPLAPRYTWMLALVAAFLITLMIAAVVRRRVRISTPSPDPSKLRAGGMTAETTRRKSSKPRADNKEPRFSSKPGCEASGRASRR
jgi:hypothetical protein